MSLKSLVSLLGWKLEVKYTKKSVCIGGAWDHRSFLIHIVCPTYTFDGLKLEVEVLK